MSDPVEQFYDQFSRRLVGDYINGNRRVEQQMRFFAQAIPEGTKSILIIGCGSGEGAVHLAQQVAPRARILALDISPKNLRLARALFPHERVEYLKADVLADPIEGAWECILFPDVYEHIPCPQRSALHETLNRLLHNNGRILLTLPSPYHQSALAQSGEGLQVVDEVVELNDLLQLASDVGATLTHFRLISIWNTNDYMHAMVEREADRYESLSETTRPPLHRAILLRLRAWWRQRRVRRLVPPPPNEATYRKSES